MSTIQHDFYHRFNSRTGIPSECHIRILSSPSRPIVIICSQVFGSDGHPSGWSISNAFEDLLDDIRAILRKQLIDEQLHEFKQCFLNSRNWICATLAIVCSLIPRVRTLLDRLMLKPWNRSKFVWLEHWPLYYDCYRSTGYWMVTIDSNGRPKWKPQEDLQELAEDLGYSLEELKKPESICKGVKYAEI